MHESEMKNLYIQLEKIIINNLKILSIHNCGEICQQELMKAE